MTFSSKNFLLALLGVSVILIGFKFFTIISFPDAITLERGKIQKIYSSQTISQQFAAGRNNLQSIQILLRTPGIKDSDHLIAKLADATCTETLAEGQFETPFLNTDTMYVFHFPRIADSKEKKYCLLLSYQGSGVSNKYLRLFTTDDRSLSLRAVYRNDHWWEDLRELNQRISQYKPWFLKNFFIGTIATIFLALSIALIALLIHLPTLQKKENP